MCRIAAYAGPWSPLSTVLYDQPHSLSEMAYRPAEMRSGHVNVDGTSIVWFDDRPDASGEVDRRPLRYRTQAPPWADQTLLELAPRLGGPVLLGAVRSTTPGIPNGTPFVHPFTLDALAGTHNGWISAWRTDVARTLVAELSDDAFAELDGVSDSAVLFLLAHDAYRAGADLMQAASEATERARRIVEAAGQSATLTLVLADHTGVAAVNAAVGRPANSLYVHDGPKRRFIVSEPLDPHLDWLPVPEGGAALMTPTRLEISPP